MKLALIASYDKLIQGLEKASDPANKEKLSGVGWDQTKYNAMEQMLPVIQAAEQHLYAATHALSELISVAGHMLVDLENALGLAGVTGVSAAAESSFRYSTSMSSSSSLSWRYNSGSVWVTTTPPNGSPGDPVENPVTLTGQSPTKHYAGTGGKEPPPNKGES
jgi:hypothetical protein